MTRAVSATMMDLPTISGVPPKRLFQSVSLMTIPPPTVMRPVPRMGATPKRSKKSVDAIAARAFPARGPFAPTTRTYDRLERREVTMLVLVRLHQILEVELGESCSMHVAARICLEEADQAIRMRIGTRPEEHGLHNGEYRGVGADTECEGEDRDRREPRALSQYAPGGGGRPALRFSTADTRRVSRTATHRRHLNIARTCAVPPRVRSPPGVIPFAMFSAVSSFDVTADLVVEPRSTA